MLKYNINDIEREKKRPLGFKKLGTNFQWGDQVRFPRGLQGGL